MKRKIIPLRIENDVLEDIEKIRLDCESRNHRINVLLRQGLDASPLSFMTPELREKVMREARQNNTSPVTLVNEIIANYFTSEQKLATTNKKICEKQKTLDATFEKLIQDKLKPGYYSLKELMRLANLAGAKDERTQKRLVNTAAVNQILYRVNNTVFEFQTERLCPHYREGQCVVLLKYAKERGFTPAECGCVAFEFKSRIDPQRPLIPPIQEVCPNFLFLKRQMTKANKPEIDQKSKREVRETFEATPVVDWETCELKTKDGECPILKAPCQEKVKQNCHVWRWKQKGEQKNTRQVE